MIAQIDNGKDDKRAFKAQIGAFIASMDEETVIKIRMHYRACMSH